MLKKLVTATFISFLLLSTSAMATTLKDNQIVDSNKCWTIHFNEQFVFDDLSKQGVIIIDSKGNNSNINLSLGQDKKTIIVSAPVEGYVPGEKYKLLVNNKVHTKSNKNLKQEVVLNFSIGDGITQEKAYQLVCNNFDDSDVFEAKRADYSDEIAEQAGDKYYLFYTEYKIDQSATDYLIGVDKKTGEMYAINGYMPIRKLN
ncbi:hypothetical protein [Clostridium tagluense]|uniref:hypothetical protein n=1 Tax=Clostridium tagluense TaxID=360422 RepID=UPI001CF28C40|nr:hypothetical protein [Clostridium tagluense]MCB2300564.1 hypothetical protein [Clostridium tagluense]